MPDISRASLCKRRFHDNKNYPYGFSRSGDFTIAESRVLSINGTWLKALTDGDIEPTDDVEKNIVSVVKGKVPPQTSTERVWLKYLKRIHRVRPRSLTGYTPDDTQKEPDETDALSDSGFSESNNSN